MGWSGPFEPGQSSWVYGGQKLAVKPSHRDWAIQIPAQQTRIEIDVLNLGSAGDLTIFRPLAFIEIPRKSGGQHKEFFSESTSLRGRSGHSNPVNPLGYMGVKSWQSNPATGTGRSKYLRNKLVSRSMC